MTDVVYRVEPFSIISLGHSADAAHVRRLREIYAERRGALLDAARERLAGALAIRSTPPRVADIPTAGLNRRVFTSGSRRSM